MKEFQNIARELMALERAAWWSPRVRRILKAAPLVVMFLLLNTRSARAVCSFNPTPDPTADGSPNSLRRAIRMANASAQDCLIQLQAGTYTLTRTNTHPEGENEALLGDLDITDSGHTVTIVGNGAKVSIVNGNHIDRVFQVLGGANAVFRKLTIEGGVAQDGGGLLVQDGGQVSLSRVWLNGNQAQRGGGLFLSSGAVDLTDSKVSGNFVKGPDGANGSSWTCTTDTAGCNYHNVHASPGEAGGNAAGGGLYVLSGSVRLLGTTISDNRAAGGRGGAGGLVAFLGTWGGAISHWWASGGDGGAAQGAGLFVGGGALSLRQTAVSGNSGIGGSAGGGGTWSANIGAAGGSSRGAGIFVTTSDINIANSTFFANTAKGGNGGGFEGSFNNTFPWNGPGGDAAGGGLYLGGGDVSLAGVTLASNQALTTTVERSPAGLSSGGGIANPGASGLVTNTTLIGNNTQDSDPNSGDDVAGSITSSYSLIGQIAGATITDGGGDIFNVDPELDPGGLKSNGGPTQTVALETGSPAIDAVPLANCTDLASPPNPLIIDQRGFPRPDAGEANCDIGAYEVQDTAFVPFSRFGGGLRIDPDTGVFYLSGGFKLGASGSIDPTTQPVAFGVGDYAIRLPAGSFVKNSKGYVYQKTVNGIFLCVYIKFTSTPGVYQLLANRIGGTLTDTGSPVPVALTIGNNNGTSLMNATFY